VFLRPSSVAVHDDSNMPGKIVRINLIHSRGVRNKDTYISMISFSFTPSTESVFSMDLSVSF
jgi:hypothetical protein